MGASKKTYESLVQDAPVTPPAIQAANEPQGATIPEAMQELSADPVFWHTEALWQSNSLRNFIPALTKFHQKNISIKKDRTVPVNREETKFRSYVTLDEIIAKVKPALADCGLVVTQHLAGSEVITMLLHSSGEFMASKIAFSPMQGNNINNMQAAGGGLSYLRRYALTGILFISSEEDDDAATSTTTIVAKPPIPAALPKAKSLPGIPDTKLPEIRKWLDEGHGTLDQVKAKYNLTILQTQFLTEIK